MKVKRKIVRPSVIASMTAVAVFALLSVLAGGLVEFSQEVGLLRWLRDVLVYSLTNKLAYKLSASILFGLVAYFASSMIAYSRSLKNRRHVQATRVSFKPTDSGMSRIA